MCNFTYASLEASEKEKQLEDYAGNMLIKRCDWNVNQDCLRLTKEGDVLISTLTWGIPLPSHSKEKPSKDKLRWRETPPIVG